MREAATKRQPPPPPQFYSFNPSTGTINTTNNNDDSNDQSDTSKNSSMNDLSVLSPNLKSFLDKGTSSARSESDNSPCYTPNNSMVARNTHKRQQQQEQEQEEEQVYSPHMAALSSPPFNYYYYQDGENNDGLLHSIFSAKKVKRGKKKRRGATRRTHGRSNGNTNNKSGGRGMSREEEDDILELFSPGVQEFDLDEALAASNNDEDEHEAARIDNERGAEDEMTLDSVDRIVRGDYLKSRRQISHSDDGVGGGGVSAEVAGGAMSFTSPTAATGSNKSFAAITPPPPPVIPAATGGEVAASTTPTTTPVMGNTVKTPTYSTPSNNKEEGDEYEQFYTPVQTSSDNTTNNHDWAVQLSTTSQRGGGGSLSSSLAPVYEEEEELMDKDDVVGEELFFSPLAVGAKSPNQQQQQRQQHVTLENESYNDTIIEEWENKNNLTEMMANEVNGTNHHHQQQQQWQSPPPVASPKYTEMREELQQMLVEAKKLTPCKEEEEEEELVVAAESSPVNGFIADDEKENVQPTTMTSPEPTRRNTNLNYSPPSTTPNSHHHHHHYHHQTHSSSITSVSPEQITLDFVKQCNCLDTLKEILSRLSLDDRYPSLRRYVEKRIKIVTASAAADSSMIDAEGEDELVERQYQEVVGAVHDSGEVAGNEGVDKENVLPEVHHHDQRDEDSDANIQEERRSVPPPLETLSLSQSPGEERNEVVDSNNELSMHHRHRQITPENQSIEERSESIMTHETSLDMNLSESLDDESFYWRQGGGDQEDQEKVQPLESQPMKTAENFDRDVLLDASKEQYGGIIATIAPSALSEDKKCTPPELLQEKLAAHAQLTERVESLVKEHAIIKAELTSKLDQAREQLLQRQSQASAEKEEYTKQVSHLTQVNETLEQEISSLKRRLEVVEQETVDAASQAELQLDQTRLIQAKLSKENERLGKELDEARQARDRGEAEALRLKQILDERVANADINDSATKRIRKGLEAAKFANHALANALAISEKDLSEALHEKEESARECNSLRERIEELEDKSSWLSSKVNEMTKELQSSHKYIDKLYSDLQSNRSPSKEMKAEFQRKEMQWLDLERQYNRRIQELERQIAGQSGSKVSMAEYVKAVREYRKHESEAIQKQRRVNELESTVSTLKQQIETMQRRPSPRNVTSSMTSRGKSIPTMRSYGKKVHNVPSAIIENDENKAPSGDMGGKKIRRMTALKAVGGRKGLSEQLRRARRVGEEE